MKTSEIPIIVEKIKHLLPLPGSNYFSVYTDKDTRIDIRVADFPCDSIKEVLTLSFISKKPKRYKPFPYEWKVSDPVNMIADTNEPVKDILERVFDTFVNNEK